MRTTGLSKGFASATLFYAALKASLRVRREGFWKLKLVTESRAVERTERQVHTAESLKQMTKSIWLFYTRRLTKALHFWKAAVIKHKLIKFCFSCQRIGQLLRQRTAEGFYAVLAYRQTLLAVKIKTSSALNRMGQAWLRVSAFERWRRVARYRLYKLKLDAQARLLHYRVSSTQTLEARVLGTLYTAMLRSVLVSQAGAYLHWREVATCMSQWERHSYELSQARLRSQLKDQKRLQQTQAMQRAIDPVTEGELVQEILGMLTSAAFSL
jgi:hypothetical protein